MRVEEYLAEAIKTSVGLEDDTTVDDLLEDDEALLWRATDAIDQLHKELTDLRTKVSNLDVLGLKKARFN